VRVCSLAASVNAPWGTSRALPIHEEPRVGVEVIVLMLLRRPHSSHASREEERVHFRPSQVCEGAHLELWLGRQRDLRRHQRPVAARSAALLADRLDRVAQRRSLHVAVGVDRSSALHGGMGTQ
jgi:hypothetical protein